MSSGEIIEQKEHQIAQLKAENTQLREELDWLKRQFFGQKRERFEGEHPEQLALDLGQEVKAPAPLPVEEEQISYTRKKRPNIPVVIPYLIILNG